MKEAIGYTTDDDRFFESMEEAEEHEAFAALYKALRETVYADDVDMIIRAIAVIPNEVGRYISANQAATRYREIQASVSAEDQVRREGAHETLLQQSLGIYEPLPNMGSGQQQKEVQLERKINGLGGGGVDASDVRSGENLAVGTHTVFTKARAVYGPPDIRKITMD